MQLEAGDAEEDKTEEERTQDEDKETPEETETILEEFQFDDDKFGQSKSKLNVRWNRMKDISNSIQLKSEQKDPDIQKWIQQEDPTRIKRIQGLVCRIWTPKGSPGTTFEQIILPRRYRNRVIKLPHDIPLAGHLGQEKTAQRILRRFYCPTLFQDVRQHCQVCEECQLHGGRRRRAPMIPLPVIGEPFRRIAMDIVGPLPQTRRGNHFILVVSDYATRYPEAVPLSNITAPKVAKVLMDLFSRHGVPEEILTDQGTNFTSALLGELYRLISVTTLQMSPYHPQTDEPVERFNHTLKSMLRKILEGEKRDWDRMLSYVLFAYQEVPHATLGLSFLSYSIGCDIHGPLDVFKEDWI